MRVESVVDLARERGRESGAEASEVWEREGGLKWTLDWAFERGAEAREVCLRWRGCWDL